MWWLRFLLPQHGRRQRLYRRLVNLAAIARGRWQPGHQFRLAILSHRTHRDRVDEAVDLLEKAAKQ